MSLGDLLSLHIDSLYLSVPGDFSHLAEIYLADLEGKTAAQKKTGVPLNRHYTVRGGARGGYGVSVWSGDARVFFSLSETQGAWIQLGPKFLQLHGTESLRAGLLQFCKAVGMEVSLYTLFRLNRIDIACDVIFDIGSTTPDEWLLGFVGRSSSKFVYTAEDSKAADYGDENGQRMDSVVVKGRTLETFAAGKTGAVRLRVYNKIKEAAKDGDLDFWYKVWGSMPEAATRFEYQFMFSQGKFQFVDGVRFEDLLDLLREGIAPLVDYALSQGELRVKDSLQKNVSRWAVHPVWADLVARFREGLLGELGKPLRRVYSVSAKLSEQYLKRLSGWMAGAMARAGIENQDEHVSWAQIWNLLTHNGYGYAELETKARVKMFELWPLDISRRLAFAGVNDG